MSRPCAVVLSILVVTVFATACDRLEAIDEAAAFRQALDKLSSIESYRAAYHAWSHCGDYKISFDVVVQFPRPNLFLLVQGEGGNRRVTEGGEKVIRERAMVHAGSEYDRVHVCRRERLARIRGFRSGLRLTQAMPFDPLFPLDETPLPRCRARRFAGRGGSPGTRRAWCGGDTR